MPLVKHLWLMVGFVFVSVDVSPGENLLLSVGRLEGDWEPYS